MKEPVYVLQIAASLDFENRMYSNTEVPKLLPGQLLHLLDIEEPTGSAGEFAYRCIPNMQRYLLG
jgi:hypothetical protein